MHCLGTDQVLWPYCLPVRHRGWARVSSSGTQQCRCSAESGTWVFCFMELASPVFLGLAWWGAWTAESVAGQVCVVLACGLVFSDRTALCLLSLTLPIHLRTCACISLSPLDSICIYVF